MPTSIEHIMFFEMPMHFFCELPASIKHYYFFFFWGKLIIVGNYEKVEVGVPTSCSLKDYF
jgi:hypothetical protein